MLSYKIALFYHWTKKVFFLYKVLSKSVSTGIFDISFFNIFQNVNIRFEVFFLVLIKW